MVKNHQDDTFGAHPRLARLAEHHYGHVTRRQLLAAGFTAATISSWLRRGILIRVHHGVYAVGYRRTEPIARAAAAVLAGGPRAALSHRSALANWDVLTRWPDPPEVSTPAHRRAGAVCWHRLLTLQPGDVRIHRGVRTVSAVRALLDVAPQLDDDRLAGLVARARIERRAYPAEIDALTTRLPTHPGATRLRAAALGGEGPTRSQFERRFFGLLRRHGIPRPQSNVLVAGVEADFVFTAERVIVELDGWDFHRDRARFVRDRRRDAATLAAGYETLRLTYEDLEREREAQTARMLRAHLARRRAELGLS